MLKKIWNYFFKQKVKENNLIDDSPESFIQNLLNKMVAKTHSKYPDKIFYLVDGKIYFEMNIDPLKIKNDHVWCRYPDFWEVLRDKYQYSDITTLIKNELSKHLKCDIGFMLMKIKLGTYISVIEEELKNEK